jgi:hypothetical protein
MKLVRSSFVPLVLGLSLAFGCGSSSSSSSGADASGGATGGMDGGTGGAGGGTGGSDGGATDAGMDGTGVDASAGGGTGGASGGTGGSDAGSADAGAGGSAGDAGTAGAGGAAGAAACNAVAISAPMVHPALGVGIAPLPTGGTIVDGTYFLTKYESFKGDAATTSTYQVVLVIAGSQIQLAQIVNAEETRATLTLTTTTNAFKAFYTCPSTVMGSQLAYDQYTATPTQLLLYGKERVLTLTLQ